MGLAILAQASERITVEGNAVILQGDQASARESAIHDGQHRALEKVIERLLTSEEKMSQHYDLLSEKIFPVYDRYIRSFEVMTEGKSSDRYWLEMTVEVETELLREDLRKLDLLPKGGAGEGHEGTHLFRLTLFDLPSPQLWDQFQKEVSKVSGVKSVTLRAFSAAALICEVVGSLDEEMFQSQLQGLPIDGYKVDMQREERGEFKLRFVRAE
ncbi:MAG: hypothetical protein HY538_03085 [Deltaproteobacteria bacterium]|nr:hypothetical protein [Deltaproteobacteria bacterium]